MQCGDAGGRAAPWADIKWNSQEEEFLILSQLNLIHWECSCSQPLCLCPKTAKKGHLDLREAARQQWPQCSWTRVITSGRRWTDNGTQRWWELFGAQLAVVRCKTPGQNSAQKFSPRKCWGPIRPGGLVSPAATTTAVGSRWSGKAQPCFPSAADSRAPSPWVGASPGMGAQGRCLWPQPCVVAPCPCHHLPPPPCSPGCFS